MTHAPGAIGRPMATARLKLGAGASQIDVPVSVPADAVSAEEALPAIRRLQNELVTAAERAAAHEGRTISCKAGCGACCRQPVPLADIEVDALIRLVEQMAEPRRSIVRERFRQAEQRLEEIGMAARLREMGERGADDRDVRATANAYFRLGIPCPFLEDESCSIYPDRPVTCRAYVVTSPASLCRDVSSREIKTLPVLHLSPALQTVSAAQTTAQRRWSVMTLMYDWRRRHAPADRRQPGPFWINALLQGLQALHK